MAAQPVAAGSWLSASERGSVLGIQLIVWAATLVGRAPVRFFVRILALYYLVFHASGRRASREYLTRVQGRASLRMQYEHFVRFAEAAVDRVFIVSGKRHLFEVTCTGRDHLVRLARERQGAILLGAHLGSFEAMRMQGDKDDFKINILGHFSNARMINAALERLNPRANARVISIDDGGGHFVLSIRDRIKSGEMIAILGDRVGPDGRLVKARFLGAEADFPTGPYVLASLLKCPIYLTFGLYRAPNRYDLYCEPFAEEVMLPREGREAALAAYAQKFADRLEHYARLAPDNWFNFYDFWKGTEAP
jgi:predicted LPLAT superfamily acyltransferase